MTKTRSTKRALLLSALSLLLCVSMLVGSTFAWFTDSVTSGQNTIQSGNLDVELYYTYDAAVAADVNNAAWVKVTKDTDVFGYNLWEPGYTKVAYFKVVNEGSLELKYQLAADVYEEKPGVNQAGAEFLLSDYIKTALVNVGATRDQILAMEGAPLKNSYDMSKGSLAAKGTAVVGLAIWMPTTVNNVANHDGKTIPEITFGINLLATQKNAESDSFGNDYDEDAWVKGMKVYNAQDLQAAISNGETAIMLMADITTNQISIPANTSVTVNLNGYSLTAPVIDETTGKIDNVFNNYGELTIVGKGTIRTRNMLNNPGAKLVIDGDITINGGAPTAGSAIWNEGDAVISGATINQNNTTNYAVQHFGNGTMTIDDVTVNGQHGGIAVHGGTVTIKGGTFTNANEQHAGHTLYVTGGEVIVQGGTFNHDQENASAHGNALIYTTNGKVTINGGTFDSEYAALAYTDMNVSITAGTFANKAAGVYHQTTGEGIAEFVAAGYKAVANGDGTYSVLPDVGTDLTAVAGYPGVYSGTQAKTYYINGADGLVNASKLADTLSTGEGNGASFTLMGNVDMTGKTWKPIDRMWVIFDGDGHTISNLTAEAWKAGLFGYLGGGEIKNLTLENVNITGAQAGAFAGNIDGTITNCYLKGDNTITWAPKYQFEDPNGNLEAWNGIGAITGVAGYVAVNAEIVEGATVTLNKAGFVTDPGCTFIDNLTGYINPNVGTVTNNGKIAIGVSSTAELIDAVKNAPVGSETTIVMADGTYAGDINITVAALGKSGGDVVIKAANGAKPVIAGSVTLGYRNQGVGSAMYQANVTFEGITFDHAAVAHSLNIQDVKSLTLKNCTVIGEDEHGIVCARGNGTGTSKIVGCTFENAGLQLLGNYATGLVIEKCTFNNSCVNVQAGNGVTVQNCVFNNTLTAAHIDEGFYAIRSNSTPITVKDCKINIDSELTAVATAQAKWYLLANRGTTNWTVENVAVTLSDAALMQNQLLVTACTSTGVINTTNLTVNGIAK